MEHIWMYALRVGLNPIKNRWIKEKNAEEKKN